MKVKKTSSGRLTWMLLSGACGLALVAGLLLLALLPVRAKPTADPIGAALNVEKQANTDFADAGDTLTYTVSIEKLGAYTTSAWLTDRLPAQLTYVTDSLRATDGFGDPVGTFGAQGDVITWYEPSLAGNVWITFSAQISPETEVDIVNVAEVTGTGELITDSWETRIGGGLLYLPMIFRRWPPVPYAPTLAEIENPDQEEDYTVSWTYGYSDPPADSYTLQEARNAGFTENATEFSVTGTSKAFNDKDAGTYYYRVRGNNSYGPGPWSNARSVRVAFRDDFDDPDSGWEVRRTSSPDLGKMDLRYRDGKLYTKCDDRWDFGLFSPLVEAPLPPYKITMKTKLDEGVDAPGYGIVFRGEKGDFCPVDRGDAEDDDGCFSHYFRLNVSIDKAGEHIRYSVKRIQDHDERGRAEGKDLSDGYHNIDDEADWNGWNKWEIEVHEDRFKIYVNGEYIGTYYDDDYANDRHFGILTSTYEYGPSEFKHEYFYVEPIN